MFPWILVSLYHLRSAAATAPLEEAKKIMSTSHPRLQSAPARTMVNYAMDYPPPRPVIPKFEGDPTHYLTFTKTFKTHIGERGLSSSDACLTYLLQHCSQRIQRRLEHYQSKTDGFSRAWHALYLNYGAASYCSKLLRKGIINVSQD